MYPTDSVTQKMELEYDTLNRLIKSRLDGAETTYRYDNAGNRLVKITPEGTTVYLRHGELAVAMDIELPADTEVEKARVNRYVLKGDLLAGRITTVRAADGSDVKTKSYYHLDHLNSTKAVSDAAGEVEVIYEYRAFGEQLKRLGSSGSETEDSAKYSYGGKELDGGSELYYFNARYYDAATGRFINVDPIQDGSNWYVYVNNNPLNRVDPTGLIDFAGMEPQKMWNILGVGISNSESDVLIKSHITPAETNLEKIYEGRSDAELDQKLKSVKRSAETFEKIGEILDLFGRNTTGDPYNFAGLVNAIKLTQESRSESLDKELERRSSASVDTPSTSPDFSLSTPMIPKNQTSTDASSTAVEEENPAPRF